MQQFHGLKILLLVVLLNTVDSVDISALRSKLLYVAYVLPRSFIVGISVF